MATRSMLLRMSIPVRSVLFLLSLGAVGTGHTGTHFKPCSARHLGMICIEGMTWGENIICKAGKNAVVLADNTTKSVCVLHTVRPYAQSKIATLACTVRAMAYLEEGLVALTTDTRSLYLLDVTKQPVGVTAVSIPKLYSAIAPGLQDTIIVSADDKPGTLDVIGRDGRRVNTIQLASHAVPRGQCQWTDVKMVRMRDCVLLSGSDCKITKINLIAKDEGNSPYYLCPMSPQSLFVDHMDNLYVSSDYYGVSVMGITGEWRYLNMLNWGGIVVNEEGEAFTEHPSMGHMVYVLVHDLTKH